MMAEGGSIASRSITSRTKPRMSRTVVRNTLRELLLEIPGFQQLTEWGISPTLVAGG